jgi:hypothetical protein
MSGKSDRHQWAPDDSCRRCGLRRSGYSGGRTGSMSYTPLRGPVRDRAGACATGRARACPERETDEQLRQRLAVHAPKGGFYSAQDLGEAGGAELDALAQAAGTKRYGAEGSTT